MLARSLARPPPVSMLDPPCPCPPPPCLPAFPHGSLHPAPPRSPTIPYLLTLPPRPPPPVSLLPPPCPPPPPPRLRPFPPVSLQPAASGPPPISSFLPLHRRCAPLPRRHPSFALLHHHPLHHPPGRHSQTSLLPT